MVSVSNFIGLHGLYILKKFSKFTVYLNYVIVGNCQILYNVFW